ncbi:MAG TPA: lysophospholipid acyltransferase family protein [Thermoanaerobaculia bacterium]|jgi:hypothetical protein
MKLLSFMAYLVVRILTATLRVRHVHPERLERTPQYILAFWHSHLLPVLGCARWRHPISVMVSRSHDGELIARVLGHYGVASARGSSSRGGSAALREFVREGREGRNLVFTPDGPRGPARVAKEGVVTAARLTGLPLQPIAVAARRKKFLGSWDRMLLPFPFTRTVCVYGEPLLVPRDAEAEPWRARLEQTLNALSDEAERLVDER